jgi:hypothetical protein
MARRNHTLKFAVLQIVIGDTNRQSLFRRIQRGALGTAHDLRTPSISRRKSQCSREA